ncbi:hypothetical protein GOP47_0016316 [Adiantum capillus-veneris]|uniref:Uncharacterized protein n=1 Tax=Adiantum capillus-veneris TaxID=13818 RepID=A0A9D4UHE9_ADICA|nr:hypothetical protein GOP47_0016316 [Adiantum capillus-veneris]
MERLTMSLSSIRGSMDMLCLIVQPQPNHIKIMVLKPFIKDSVAEVPLPQVAWIQALKRHILDLNFHTNDNVSYQILLSEHDFDKGTLYDSYKSRWVEMSSYKDQPITTTSLKDFQSHCHLYHSAWPDPAIFGYNFKNNMWQKLIIVTNPSSQTILNQTCSCMEEGSSLHVRATLGFFGSGKESRVQDP